jgi:aminoglycoside phosphotransferase (APT) family kinase protein
LLSSADAAVVQRDPALPDLALLLDPDQLLAALERTLDRRLSRPAITYLRYKRGQSCLAACRMEINGTSVDFAAKHHRADAEKLQDVMTRPAIAGPLGPGRFLLANTDIVVSVFPNDGKLKKLAWLGSEEAIAHVAHRIAGPGDAPTAQIHTLHFNPERRFVGRLTIGGRSRATIRCYRRQDYVDTVDKPGRFQSRGPLKLARSLDCDARNHVVVLEWLEGLSLEAAIAEDAPADDLRLVGAALAELHVQQTPALPLRTGSNEAAAILSLADDLADLCPELERDARRLAGLLAQRLAAHEQYAWPVHGDFYARQVVLGGGAAGVLDLDGAVLGHPAIDLGRFRADLESAVIRGRLDLHTVDAMTEWLLEGYQSTRGVRPHHIDLYAAAHLFYLTPHPFRRRELSWRERSAALLERARRLLEASDRASATRTAVRAATEKTSQPVSPRLQAIDPVGAAQDATMPFLPRALDVAYMTEQFGTLRAFQSSPLQVTHIAVTRYKPGRRCVIAYQVGTGPGEDTQMLVGKVRQRGPDIATHQLVEQLWTSEFGSDARDGISVPEPLGFIAALHMTVQRKVAGIPVERLLDGPSGRHLAHRAAEAIDKLHRAAPPAARRHSIGDEIEILERRLSSVGREVPLWRDRLQRLLAACRQLAGRVASATTCGIHRDFYPNQLLADGDRIYMLDLDLYSEGHPALDVGNFLAHIDEYSLRRFGDPDRLADRKQVLTEGYLELSRRTTAQDIDAYANLALARHIGISREFPDRRPYTEALLELCEQRLLGSERKKEDTPLCDSPC